MGSSSLGLVEEFRRLVERLRRALRREAERLGLAYAVLYGSQAYGRPGPLSDVDVLVEFEDRRLDLGRLAELASILEDAVGRRVEVVQASTAPPLLRYEAFTRGVTLYVRHEDMLIDDKVRSVLEWLDFKPIYERHARRLVKVYRDGD